MAASTRFIVKGQNILVLNVQGVFASADETDTVIIDKSTLVGPHGGTQEPSAITIQEITWNVSSVFSYVLLEWDHTTDDILDYFSSSGYMDYRNAGGMSDPASSGGTGDLLLSTVGGSSGASYSFWITATLKE